MRLLERPADPVLDYFSLALSPYCSSSLEASEAATTVRETLSLCGAAQSWTSEMEIFMLGRMVYLFGGTAALVSFFKDQGVGSAEIPFYTRLIVCKISAIDGFRLIDSRVLTYQQSALNSSGGVWTLRLDLAINEASSAFELGYMQVLKRIFSSLATLSQHAPAPDVVKVEGLERLESRVAAEVKQTLPTLLKACFSLHKAPAVSLIWAI